MATITIDDQVYEAEKGVPVLEVLKSEGIPVPYLCYHPALKPSGACRLCAVEVRGKTGKPVTMLSCILKVKDGLDIRTTSDIVVKARIRAFNRLLQLAPESQVIRDLAETHGVDLGPPPDGCIRCRLCIRVCKEVVGAGALKMEKREGRDVVVPVEGLCIGCGTCVNICPTRVIHMEDKDAVRTLSIRHDIIGIHALERCEACGIYFASQKFLNHVEQRVVERHPDVKEHHKYCPTCAKLFSDRIKSFARLRKQ